MNHADFCVMPISLDNCKEEIPSALVMAIPASDLPAPQTYQRPVVLAV